METDLFTSTEFTIALFLCGAFIVLDMYMPRSATPWLRPFAVIVLGAAFARSAGWV